MKSYDALKALMDQLEQQIMEAKKRERTGTLKEVKRLCKELGFTTEMLKGALAKGREKVEIQNDKCTTIKECET